MPQKFLRDAAGISSASRLIDSPDVFDATIASAPMCGAIFSYSARFVSQSSAIASMIRSHDCS